MLNRILTFTFCCLLIISCDKETAASKQLNGEWNLISYKRMELNGLTYFADAQGRMTFNKQDQSSNRTYTFQIDYSFSTNVGSIAEFGTIEMIEKGDFMLVNKMNELNLVISTTKYRLLTHTKTDLHIEFSDSLGRMHTLILEKK